ncbi:MAG: LysR substrate-binding domain-containing protein [Kiloniellales bacterium]
MNSLRKRLPPLSSLLPFEAAARHESFTLAAQELHLTQAAVSRQIRALEDDLGLRLFERRQRAVFLTEAGRDLAQAVTAGLDGIAARASDLRGRRRSGEVVLFAELCSAVYWLMPRLADFHQRHPDLEVRVSASLLPVGQSSEDFDVALQTAGRPSGAHALAFTASDDVIPVCSADYFKTHLAGRRAPLPLAELPQHRLLHHRVHPQDWPDWDDWLQRLGCDLRVGDGETGGVTSVDRPNGGGAVVFDSYPVLIQAAVEGHGIGLGWRRAMEQLLQSGKLVRPFAESVTLDDGLAVYRHKRSQERPAVKALLAWLKAQLA